MYRIMSVLIIMLLIVGGVHAQELIAETTLETRTGTAYGLRWNPDGTLLAATTGHELTILDSNLNILAQMTEADIADNPMEGFLNAAWSPDGSTLAVVGGLRSRVVHLIEWDADAQTLIPVGTLDISSDEWERGTRSIQAYSVSWNEDGSRLAVLVNDRTPKIQIWDMTTQTPATFLDFDYELPARNLVWDGDQLIFTGTLEGSHKLFSADTLSSDLDELLTIPTEDVYFEFDLSADHSQLSLVSSTGQVSLIDITSGETLVEFETVPEPVAVTWAGEQIAILSYQRMLHIYTVPTAS